MTYDHASSPKDSDGWKETAGANLAQDDGGGWLEENVGDKKDEHDETVSFSDQFKAFRHTANRQL